LEEAKGEVIKKIIIGTNGSIAAIYIGRALCKQKFLGVQNPFFKKGSGRRRHNISKKI
jgi:hypothetical protein